MAPTLLPLLLAALTATTCGLTTSLPRIKVTLTPQFSAPNTTTTTTTITTITALDITLHLSHLPQPNTTTSPAPPSHYPLLQLDLNHGLTPTQQYNDTSLIATDALGPLPLTHTDTNATDAQRTWFTSRHPHGPVVMQFRAVPRVWMVPEGVRVASSLGDRVRETAVGLPGRVLAKAYFAVGALRRWPGWEVEVVEGERPFYVERMAGIAKDMHGAIASFFGDVDTPFRGIHEYALMSPSRQYDMWYREGVAQFYAVVAPFAAGAVDKSYLIRWLNNNAQSYYTSGMAGKTWQSIIENYWTSTQNVKAPYGTGFVYLAQVQGLIAKATNGTKDLDDLTLELYRRFVAHEKVQTGEFLEVLSGLGKVASFTSNRTRAEEAGLRVGDEVVRMWGEWGASDSLDNMMRVVVRRDGSEVNVDYWPRSYETVENWVWEEDDTVVNQS
ncbi:hypothetical protein F5144DRAFT_652091 [Chaetomium tenue]|uniref:Uncharacterized protein n=1 Tax=Chaetomium tenue TaxID=1854479 RepID=A0ACB7P5A7_9PEZI|nr:hypothetical protein F5144DRAFT_652091 [Chaetomium globosum]